MNDYFGPHTHGATTIYSGEEDPTCPICLPPPSDEHESDQSRYASECDRCETDGHLHMWDCPNNPLRDPA